jgi:GH35 family endo-1,4-beta-xylanase
LHAFLKQVAKLDLQVFVTEFNIDNSQLATKSEKREKQVAQLCRDYLEECAETPPGDCGAGVAYGESPSKRASGVRPWFRKQHIALPLDENLCATPFLSAMIEAIEKR